MSQAKEVMYDSPEAARKVEMMQDGKVISTGYLSADNFFFYEERLARYKSHTHSLCECGAKMKRGYTLCDSCRQKSRREKYNELPIAQWDGKTMVYDEASDKFFSNPDEIEEYLEEDEVDEGSLMLLLCEPQMYNTIDSEYWEDVLPEDGEVNGELMKRVNELNKFIKTLKPASWCAGKTRVVFTKSDQ